MERRLLSGDAFRVCDTLALFPCPATIPACPRTRGRHLLATHKPKVLTEQLAREFDLILVMDQSLLREDKCTLKGWPSAYGGKVYLFKEFFGLEGDVTDPWPDGKDEKTLAKYRACAIEMRETMEKNFDRLLQALHG